MDTMQLVAALGPVFETEKTATDHAEMVRAIVDYANWPNANQGPMPVNTEDNWHYNWMDKLAQALEEVGIGEISETLHSSMLGKLSQAQLELLYNDIDPKFFTQRAKTGSLLSKEDHPVPSTTLQQLVGDPNDQATSSFAQYKTSPGDLAMANPLSPIQGDEVFFTFMQPGSIFQSKDGHTWQIREYDWDGRVEIQDVWYPQTIAQVTVNDVRRSIHSWVEPITQVVPDPPAGVDYGSQPVIIKH